MDLITLAAGRRIREHSWKDILIILVIAVVFLGVKFVLRKVSPTMESRFVKIICYAISIGIGLIVMICTDA